MRRTPATHSENALFRMVLLVFGAQLLCLLGVCFFLHGVRTLFYDSDFHFLYDGAHEWLRSGAPYSVFGFVTPPLSLVIPFILSPLSLEHAKVVFFCVNLALLSFGMWRYLVSLGFNRRECWLFLGVASLFPSAQVSVLGGNLDGVMLVLLIAAFGARRKEVGAASLAASIGMKAYSVILLPVILRRRQWKYAAITIVTLFLLMLPFHHIWPAALHAMFFRAGRFAYGSISPAALVFAIGLKSRSVYTRIGLAFWLFTFCLALYRDNERELTPRTLARYVPWMLAWPALVFSYVGVLALTVFASLIATAKRRPLQWTAYITFMGFLLLGLRLDQVTDVLPLSYFSYTLASNIPALGVALMLVGTCLTPSADIPDTAVETRAEPALEERVNA